MTARLPAALYAVRIKHRDNGEGTDKPRLASTVYLHKTKPTEAHVNNHVKFLYEDETVEVLVGKIDWQPTSEPTNGELGKRRNGWTK